MDAAALALKVDSTDVVKAASDLDKFSAASTRAATASGKTGAAMGNQSGSIARLVVSAQSMNTKLSGIISALDKVNAGLSANAKTSQGAAAANDNAGRAIGAADAHVIAYTQHLAGLAAQQQQVNAHVVAWQNNLQAVAAPLAKADAHVLAYRSSLNKVAEGAGAASAAIKFTAQDSLNASRQLADIGVTAAMGMSPFLIAIQQGPQLLDILQNKASVTGQSLGAVFRAAGAAIWTALAPILPILLGIGLAVGAVASAFGLGAREINKNNGSIVEGLALTDKQMQALKKSGVDTSVTLTDTFKAFFQVTGERLATMFAGPIKTASGLWDSFLNYTMMGGEIWVKAIVGGFVGAVAGIKAGWSLLPAAIGDVAIRAVNKVVDAVAFMIEKGRDLVNGFLAATGSSIPQINFAVNKQHLTNEFAGAGQDFAEAAQKGFIAGRNATNGAIDRFFGDVGKRAIANRRKLIVAAVGDAGKGIDRAARTPKVEADPWGDLLKNADQQQRILDQAGARIGIYGQDLARLTHEQELLNAAQDKGIKLTTAQNAELMSRAAAMAAKEYENTRKTASAERDASHAEQMRQLEVERGALGLVGEALLAYNYRQQLINAELAKGVALKDIDIAKIGEQAQAYAAAVAGNDAMRKGIDDQRAAMEANREIAKGFFRDWIDGVREGESVFKSFGRSVLNTLNKIIDRMLDQALSGMLGGGGAGGAGGMMGGGAAGLGGALGGILGPLLGKGIKSLFGKLFADGGAFGTSQQFAMGGAFGMAQKFANGGSFTNQIVNSPTLFKFANGGKTGVMGEAGPEAVMPLARGPNGKLGVHAQGGGGRPNVQMGDVHLHQSFAGAIGADSIMAMNQQSSEAAISYIRREFANIAADYDANGAIVS